jgi:L,D-peptidoglycan transpeptidase YkuD (ErfK/YbiS/YcfS/YnhG family)
LTPRDLVVGARGARFLGRQISCAIGRGGVGEKRAEGDGITPVGRHRIEAVFLRLDRVWHPYGRCMARLRAAGIEIRAIGPQDAWSDDPADPAYNRRVRRPSAFSHEALRRADPIYDIVVVLDWNRHPVRPGRGSAIFLHLWRGPRRPTAGCVAFRRADLLWILERWRRESRVVVGEQGGRALEQGFPATS